MSSSLGVSSHKSSVATAEPGACPQLCPFRLQYLRAFWSRCRQSTASGQCLRDCRKRCTWGRRTLLGGKRPVHSQSSSQPRSSLYLQEEVWCPAGLPQASHRALSPPGGRTPLGSSSNACTSIPVRRPTQTPPPCQPHPTPAAQSGHTRPLSYQTHTDKVLMSGGQSTM